MIHERTATIGIVSGVSDQSDTANRLSIDVVSLLAASASNGTNVPKIPVNKTELNFQSFPARRV